MLTSILLPTYNRPAMLRECLEAVVATSGENPLEIVVVVDESHEAHAVAGHMLSLWAREPNRHFTLSYNLHRVGALKAWNQALALSRGEMLFPLGDDGLCHPGWLDYALAMHRDQLQGYGCVGLNDKMNLPMVNGAPIVQTHLLFDRKFCKDHFGGVVAFECYKYLWVDVELNERAKRIGKLAYCEASVVEHRHSAAGKRPMDAIDQEKVSANWHELDGQLFRQRLAAGFPDDFPAVI